MAAGCFNCRIFVDVMFAYAPQVTAYAAMAGSFTEMLLSICYAFRDHATDAARETYHTHVSDGCLSKGMRVQVLLRAQFLSDAMSVRANYPKSRDRNHPLRCASLAPERR